jgi:hypothetical protein
MPKSLLFVPGALPFGEVPGCSPCRQQVTVTVRKFGRLYTMNMYDKITVEDPYLVMVKAEAFALQQGEPYAGIVPPTTVRDFLIKTNLMVV